MVSEKEAQEAVKVLLGYIEGEENVDREGSVSYTHLTLPTILLV